MNSGVRVSIPNNVRKMIQNIKEITGNHSDDEIYAMLKECSMDPNETAQKLLSQDPFHEVRRKRDRKKEVVNKESTEPRWKPGMQGRGNRGGRGNYSSRHIFHDKPDKGSSKIALSTKENEIIRVADDVTVPKDKLTKDTSVVASSSSVVSNKLSDLVAEKTSTAPFKENKIPTSRDVSVSKTVPPKSGGYLSASDPILTPAQDSRLPVGMISREVGSQQAAVDQIKETTPAEIKTESVPEVLVFQGDGNKVISETSRPLSRPPSNYNNRSQQAIGPQKGGPGKEWKPKPTNSFPVETHSSIKPASNIPDSKDATSEKELRIPGDRHVIIPNHLHVPEADKLGFQFGSFDATFGINSITLSGPVSDKSPSLSEASQETVEHIEEHPTRNQDMLVTADDDGFYPDHRPSSSSNVPEILSSNVGPEPIESKQETLHSIAGHQQPGIHSSSNTSFGFVPPIIGSHLAPFESNESQVPYVSRVPNFVIQPPFDPSGYYPQFFRSGADSDGRISPFHQLNKYNGDAPPPASQSSHEVGNSSMLPGSVQTTLATQAGGSSIAVTQQPLPVFRQPTGLQLPQYPPNFIPYASYFSPLYMPPPAIHQFLSNGGAYPQQPQAGYPSPQVGPQKFPLAQYKPGSNTPNLGHIGVPGTFGPYGLSAAAGYNPNPAATSGNSSSNDDLGGSQFKENNVYASGTQSEGPGVWIAAPGRDIPGTTFYNLPQGGQVAYNPTQIPHGPFTSFYHPGQPVTTGPIHPLLQQHPQAMAGGGVDMARPTSSPYPHQQQQQPQPTQINWPNNY
ncbi:GBF-interacting protein 1-like [Rutidosis leptorrhynchoides]|uniref:GBF-interacting protein 1-like n=1 Tax=Rutidosis leptorrhynchoides TaxID=125765 RepID=UPI003A994C9F